ncbi:MAG TPA: ATP-binding protein, partial [Acidimicrobiales bacterium]|nr:ATP-binding protein [Acidimicrobiales bacterium]
LQLLMTEPSHAAAAVGPGSGLRRAALVLAPEAGPVGSAPLVPAPSVVWRLAGDRTPDPDLAPGWSRVPRAAATAPAPTSVRTSPSGARQSPADRAPLLLVTGGDRSRRAQVALDQCGPLLRSTLPQGPSEWDAVIRQASLERCAVLLDLEGALSPDARQRVEAASHLTWVLASQEELPLDCLPRVPWEEVTASRAQATAADWAQVLRATETGKPEAPTATAEQYSYTHNITAEQLELVAAAAPGVGGIVPALRRLAAGHISALAPRIRPARTWEDLVLDEERTERLREIVARSLHKHTVFGEWGFQPAPSSGVVALFSGPSGTGKTLAAEIIAGELGIDLYKIDLSALVSKWVGETEKNLSAVFAAAEASNVALFFDEADAIFGKRSEVSDAHDRYANIEVAYLLQRLERYEGVVIMATNLATNIDPAFLRRIHVSIDFPMPEEAERERIWARSLPAGAPASGLDLALLAKLFKFSGGSIRNVALTAGFIAADAGTPINMACVVEAVQREMRKLGRLVTAADFGPFAHVVGRGATTAQ